MKNPQTLPQLRALLTRAERTLTKPKVGKKLPVKTYNELANIPDVVMLLPRPSNEFSANEQAAMVLTMTRDTLNRVEVEAAREWMG